MVGLGSGVEGVAVGDEVYAMTAFDRDGVAAEYAAIFLESKLGEKTKEVSQKLRSYVAAPDRFECYLIEDGKLTRPVRGATLIGNGPEALKYVSDVGNDLALDEGIGICGKEGQSVPVGVGMPTVKIDRMTVGGTA